MAKKEKKQPIANQAAVEEFTFSVDGEQQNPVEAHGHAGQEQQRDLLFDSRQGDLLFCHQQKHGDEGRRHEGPVQCQLAGGQADAPDKGGQGAENRHGRHEHPAGIG